MPVALEKEVLAVLDVALSLRGRGASFNRDTALLGALPELDSMAVLTVITLLEERFGITIADDAIDSAAFETVGSLTDWLATQVGHS
jgi:acyl carrier protein